MEAKVYREGEYVVVRLIGHLDYDSTEPLEKTCMQHFNKEKIIFNLQDLSFVGSMGITPFVTTVAELSKKLPQGLKLCGVSSEFKRVFESGGITNIQFFENEEKAKIAFIQIPQTLVT